MYCLTEILKQPVHTSVAIDSRDFDHFLVQEGLHVAISVKDFKAIISHADTLKTTIIARYTRPCRPLQLSYEYEGMVCEFTLMTRGEPDDTVATSSNGNARELSARPYSRPPQSISTRPTPNAPLAREPEPQQEPSVTVDRPMQQPSQPVVQESVQQPPSPSFDPLFVPMDDDHQWDEPVYVDEDEEDILGWDAHNDQQVRKSCD